MGIKTVPQHPYSPDVGPCDFWLFPKLRGCRYETIEEMKEFHVRIINKSAHTKKTLETYLMNLVGSIFYLND